MLKLMENLAVEKKSALLNIFKKLEGLDVEVSKFNQQIKSYTKLLNDAKTKENFFEVIDNISRTSREANAIFSREIIGMDDDMRSVFKELSKTNQNIANMFNAVYFSDALNEPIIATKERLTEQSLYRKLSGKKLEMAKDFIDSIRSLKPIIGQIDAQKESFIAALENSTTADEVNFLENAIEERNKVFDGVYKKLTHFPEDEVVSGAVIQFLNTNTHFLASMEKFNFYESLVDNIMKARARVSNNASPGV